MQSAFNSIVRIRDRYTVRQVIYQDAFRTTYLTDDQSGGSYLVQKLMAASPTQAEAHYQRIQPELQRFQALTHPQVQQIKECFCEGDSLYVVQSYVNGQAYSDVIRGRSPFTEAELTQWLNQILSILSALHSQNATHRNLSLHTIFARQSDSLPVLTQFNFLQDLMTQMGITPTETRLLDRVVTLPIGVLPVGVGEDLYAIALSAIMLLTGQELLALFDHSSQTWDWEQYKLVSDHLTQVLNRMLSVQATERFATAEAFLQALNNPVVAPPPPVYHPPQPRSHPSPIRLISLTKLPNPIQPEICQLKWQLPTTPLQLIQIAKSGSWR
jgi:serine/threonine protein kinase